MRELDLNFDATYGNIVIGIDEAGYGSWAGPVSVAAVYFPTLIKIPKLCDSKKLSAKIRNELAAIIKENSIYSVVLESQQTIDKVNVWEATKIAMQKAVSNLNMTCDTILIDGNKNPAFSNNIVCITEGDNKSASIAAASILAKTERDNYMKKMALDYPEYGFERHFGYGTKMHREAIEKNGVCKLHRLSYKPLQQYSFAF